MKSQLVRLQYCGRSDRHRATSESTDNSCTCTKQSSVQKNQMPLPEWARTESDQSPPTPLSSEPSSSVKSREQYAQMQSGTDTGRKRLGRRGRTQGPYDSTGAWSSSGRLAQAQRRRKIFRSCEWRRKECWRQGQPEEWEEYWRGLRRSSPKYSRPDCPRSRRILPQWHRDWRRAHRSPSQSEFRASGCWHAHTSSREGKSSHTGRSSCSFHSAPSQQVNNTDNSSTEFSDL